MTCHSSFQRRNSVNIQAAIVYGYIIGPYVIQNHVSGVHYADLLQQMFLLLLEDVLLQFQQDGACPHFEQ